MANIPQILHKNSTGDSEEKNGKDYQDDSKIVGFFSYISKLSI